MFATIETPIADSAAGSSATITVDTLPGSTCTLHGVENSQTIGPRTAAIGSSTIVFTWTRNRTYWQAGNTYHIYATCTAPAPDSRTAQSANVSLNKT
jgi:hypothetical protein